MKIEKAHKEDRPAIKALIRQHPQALLQDHLPRSKSFYVARHECGIVGCCALAIYSRRIAEIRSLAVLEEFDGNGIGSALVAACVQEAAEEGIYEIFAITGEDKIAFFDKHGITVSSEEKKVALFRVLGK